MCEYTEFTISSSGSYYWTVAVKEERRDGFCLVTETASRSPESPRTPRCCLVSSANEWPNEFRKTTARSAKSSPFSLDRSLFFFMHKAHFLRSVTHSSVQFFSAGTRTCRLNSEMNLMCLLMSSVGLTWEDDTTQQVLAQELSKLRRIPYRPQQNGPVYAEDSRSDVYRSASLYRCVFPGDVSQKLFSTCFCGFWPNRFFFWTRGLVIAWVRDDVS